MGTIKDVLQHPSARLTQHLRLSIGTINSPLDVLEFRLEQELSETHCADITLTSTDQAIDGAACVGRRATFTVEEKASIPSAPGLVAPVIEPALTLHGVVTQWERVRTGTTRQPTDCFSNHAWRYSTACTTPVYSTTSR